MLIIKAVDVLMNKRGLLVGWTVTVHHVIMGWNGHSQCHYMTVDVPRIRHSILLCYTKFKTMECHYTWHFLTNILSENLFFFI